MDLHQFLRNTIDTRLVGAGLLFTLGMGLIGEAAIVWLEPSAPWSYVGVGGALLVAGVGVGRGWMARLRRRNWFEDMTGEPVRPAKVLVTVGGPNDWLGANQTVLPAVLGCGALERVVLLHTDDPPGIEGKLTFMAFAESLGLHEVRGHAVTAAATHDPRLVFAALEEIVGSLEDEGYDVQDVLIDLTSGTKCFTAAATLVGATGERRLCYARPKGNDYEVIEVDLVFQVRQQGAFGGTL